MTLLSPLLRPLRAFLVADSAGGVLLMFTAVAAMILANSPAGDAYRHLLHAKLGLTFDGRAIFGTSIEHFVNDGLMVVFFLLVGLEIKREILIGELASIRRAALPLAAAVGGMVVPALAFAMLNFRGPGAHGWGVPMATDIAFAVGVLTLVGRRVPTSVKVFLLAIAIVDDLGAVLVIALFYTAQISTVALIVAGGFLAALMLLNLYGVRRTLPYLLLGVGLWVATLASGVHATVAGVLLAFTIPARPAESSTLVRIEHALLRPVNLIIVPLFALANAGVDLRGGAASAALGSPVMWGVLLGLAVGKPVGVLLACGLATRLRVAALPEGATRAQVVGVSILCGIGFTMSLFVANLAFPGMPALLNAAKVGILAASLLCGVAGAVLIARARPTTDD